MSYCEGCGAELHDGAQFCENCGMSVGNVTVPVAANVLECEALRGSLIYRMSNGSHELFHSNVLAWVLERDHDFVGVFFPALRGLDYTVERELKHMDIVLRCKNDVYVIENKFKTLPGAYQLERYREAIEDDDAIGSFKGGVLLGVHDTLNGAYPDGWSYVDYREVSNYLKSGLVTRGETFEAKAIVQYTRLIDTLVFVLTQRIDWDGLKMPRPNDFADLEGIQLRDLCKKIQAASFAKRLAGELNENALNKQAEVVGFNFKITTSFLRGDAILEVRYFHDERSEKEQRKDDNWGAELTIGVEIHANKYLWFVKCEEKLPNDGLSSALADYFKEHEWFVDNSTLTTPTGRPQRTGLYSFGGGFDYQYLPLVNEDDYSFSSLVGKLRDHVVRAANLLPELQTLLNSPKRMG